MRKRGHKPTGPCVALSFLYPWRNFIYGSKKYIREVWNFSVIDIAFVNPTLAARTNWLRSDTYTHSNYLAIINISNIGPVRERSGRIIKTQMKGWKDETTDEEIFEQMLDENITDSSDSNERANLLTEHIRELVILLWWETHPHKDQCNGGTAKLRY